MHVGEASVDAGRVQRKTLVFDSFETQAGRNCQGKSGSAGLQYLSAVAENTAEEAGQAHHPHRTDVSTVLFYPSGHCNG